ncbi:outer membrane protein assembly factor BamB [Methylophaga sp. 41_12_T18]|nr:outer membrane protein assembly factor BamB [Methylophaga sp. 41_12_T18]
MIAKCIKRLLVLILSLSLMACGTVKGWLTDETYVAPPAELIEFSQEFTPELVWSINNGEGAADYSDLGVWLQADMVIAVDHEGEVASYEAITGRQLWQVELDVPVTTGAGGGDNLILIGSKEGEILALDETTGQLLWRKRLTSEVLAPPKASHNVVVARTADGRLTGLSAEDGSILWNYQRSVPLLSLRGTGAPVVADDKVVAGYANGKLVALSIIDGKVLWEKSIAVPRGRSELDRLVDIDATPVIKQGKVYVVSYHGNVAAVSLDTGRILWSREASSRTGLDAAVGEAVFVSDDSDYVWAYQDGSGDALWRQTRLLRRTISAPAIVGDNILVGDFEGYMHWISRADGRFVARLQVADAAIRSKPVVKDNLVYITAVDGTLAALRIQ